jgi:3-deoxy-manno-octulosonate cytidylyltransferase (CMP-KDO synthetase)
MIEHVYRRASESRSVDAVIVATDDTRIADAVRRFGGTVQMTSTTHRTGTDRTAEVARGLACDIVVSVQGDEPLIDSSVITELVAPLLSDPSVQMSTPCCAITDPRDHEDPNVVKVVKARNGDALYFSRSPIPRGSPTVGPYKHIGLYAYRRVFLLAFAAMPKTPLELAESLEQLRALEHGVRIRTVETHYDSLGVDTPEDLERARLRLVRLQQDTSAVTHAGEVA